MSDETAGKGRPTPKAPQNVKGQQGGPPAPPPRAVYSKLRAMAAGLEAAVVEHEDGSEPRASATFLCAGGLDIELIWPLEMTDAIVNGLLESKRLFEEAKGGLQVIESKLHLPPGVAG